MPSSPEGRSGAIRRPAGKRSRQAHPGATKSEPGRPARREATMAATAPETTAAGSAGWLDSFLADWRPGTGEPREVREPATGRPLLTVPLATTDDVARAAAAATAAQPAWAATGYADRAAILRRAAEIYEAHRPEF